MIPEAVVVIGGGPAGLTAAFECCLQGRIPIVLEADAELGGAVRRHRVGGIDLDAGAESFATARPAVATLIDDLGMTDRVISPNPAGAWVRHENGQGPLPAASWLGVPSRPMAKDVRRIIGLPGALRAALDRLLPKSYGASATTLGALVRARMGPAVLRRLVEPVVGGVHSADPAILEIASIAPTLPQALQATGSLAGAAARMRGAAGPSGSAVAGLVGGMNTLISGLAEAVLARGGRIETNAVVTSLTRDGDLWSVDVRIDGVEHTVKAETVLIAVPAAGAQSLLDPLLPNVSWPDPATATTAVLLATLVVRSAELNAAPRGTGMLVSARARGVRAKALTHASAKWGWIAEAAGPDRHVLRLSYGRGGELPDPAEFPDLALADAAHLLGVPLASDQLEEYGLTTWASVLPRTAPGHAALVDGVREAARQLPGLGVVGGWIAGTGLAAVVADARQEARALSHRGPTGDRAAAV